MCRCLHHSYLQTVSETLMTVIYIYDTEPNIKGVPKFLEWLMGMRYMAVAGNEYPFGPIAGYGRTPGGALKSAIRSLTRERDRKGPERELVRTDEVDI